MTLVQQFVQNNATLTLQQVKAADVKKDGYVDTGDIFKLSQYISGAISELD